MLSAGSLRSDLVTWGFQWANKLLFWQALPSSACKLCLQTLRLKLCDVKLSQDSCTQQLKTAAAISPNFWAPG